MSGRDLRNFVTTHREYEAENLVKRVGEGLLSSKYRAIDYDKLKQYTAEKKFSGHLSLAKVKKLEKASKQHKEQNVMKQHKRVWDMDLCRLNAYRRRAQTDLDLYLRDCLASTLNRSYFSEVEDYESFLENDFQGFKKSTVDPVWTLRDDLLYWLHQHHADLKAPSENLQREHRMVHNTIGSVQQQQSNILEQLRNEQVSLENELRSGGLAELVNPLSERQVETGIPAEAFELECPDEGLKASVLQEFILIDAKHLEKLDNMNERYQDALRSDTGGWAADDHFAFVAIVEQYPFDMQNRRMLYMDRLQRHFPKLTRAALVEHEDWWFLYKYYTERLKSLINDWLRDRHELLNRASVVFNEVCVAMELEEAKAEYVEKQRELCDALYQKVQIWREQKFEAMRLQEQIEEARHQEELRQQQEQRDKEQARRQKNKEKLVVFHKELSAAEKAKEEEDQRQLAELQRVLTEQAVYDKQRVQFREEQLDKKRDEQLKKEMERQEKEMEKERVLEALREQVRPNVEGDLLRLWSDTKAWQQHTKKNFDDEEIHIQKPLFEINTFSSNQVTSDPRVRLESKLREAGVLNTNYARHMISQMQPQQAPRRDMTSTVFKQD